MQRREKGPMERTNLGTDSAEVAEAEEGAAEANGVEEEEAEEGEAREEEDEGAGGENRTLRVLALSSSNLLRFTCFSFSFKSTHF